MERATPMGLTLAFQGKKITGICLLLKNLALVKVEWKRCLHWAMQHSCFSVKLQYLVSLKLKQAAAFSQVIFTPPDSLPSHHCLFLFRAIQSIILCFCLTPRCSRGVFLSAYSSSFTSFTQFEDVVWRRHTPWYLNKSNSKGHKFSQSLSTILTPPNSCINSLKAHRILPYVIFPYFHSVLTINLCMLFSPFCR